MFYAPCNVQYEGQVFAVKCHRLYCANNYEIFILYYGPALLYETGYAYVGVIKCKMTKSDMEPGMRVNVWWNEKPCWTWSLA